MKQRSDMTSVELQSKQRIKEVLRDAICALCKRTVSHDAQLSIEALVGITVDNGRDVLIVSINELIDKSDADADKSEISDSPSLYAGTAIKPEEGSGVPTIVLEEQLGMPCASGICSSEVKIEEPYDNSQSWEPQYEEDEIPDDEDKFTDAADSEKTSSLDNQYWNRPAASDQATGGSSQSSTTGLSITARRTRSATASKSLVHKLHKKKRMRMESKHPDVDRVEIYDAATGEPVADWHQSTAVETISGVCKTESGTLVTYECPECGAQFDSFASLQQHRRRRHQDVVYRCNVCSKVYTRKDTRDRHRRTTHPDYNTEDIYC